MEQNKKRFNNGTRIGHMLIKKSIENLGCGRSVLCDKNDVIICGNDVYSISKELNKKILTIETDGDTLIVIKRIDIDADSKKGMELALIDNYSQLKNLEWNTDEVISATQSNLSFDPRNWGAHETVVKELDIRDLLINDDSHLRKTNEYYENNDFMQPTLFD